VTTLLPEGHAHERARNLLRLPDLAEVSRIVEAELGRCDDIGNSGEVWSLRLIRADLTRLRGQTEEVLAYLAEREALYPPEPGDLPSQIGLKKTRGYALAMLGRYIPGHELMQQAERLAADAGLSELQCEIYQCQAVIHYLQKDYASSDRIFRLILSTSDALGGWYFRANALWGIGKNLMIQEHHREALPWLEDSLALFESARARVSLAVVWSEMAVCYLGLGDDKRALTLLENALQIQHEAGTMRNYQVALANIGNVYLHRGDYLRAIDYYRRALEIAREIKDPTSIEKWSHNIRVAYLRLRESVDNLTL
jgi:tetratricopeptide (TPR) repeat protein